MKKTPIFAIFATALALVHSDAADVEQRVAVKGTRINLRAAADPVAEVVGQVSEPDTLILQGSLEAPWVKVTPPDNIDLWIFASLVDDHGKINVKKALVRSGAGLNYNTVGELDLGAPVTIRGKVGDWLKIAPFPTAAVWITNSYVELVAPQPAQLPVPVEPTPTAPLPETAEVPQNTMTSAVQPTQTEPAQPEVAVVSHDTTAPVAPPAQAEPAAPEPISEREQGAHYNPDDTIGPAKVPASKLRAGVSQAGSGSYAGMLALSPVGVHPTPFRLVLFDDDNNPSTVCYVLGNRKQLDSLKGQNFTIEGAVYWFEGTDLPTIFAQNILRHRGR